MLSDRYIFYLKSCPIFLKLSKNSFISYQFNLIQFLVFNSIFIKICLYIHHIRTVIHEQCIVNLVIFYNEVSN